MHSYQQSQIGTFLSSSCKIIKWFRNWTFVSNFIFGLVKQNHHPQIKAFNVFQTSFLADTALFIKSYNGLWFFKKMMHHLFNRKLGYWLIDYMLLTNANLSTSKEMLLNVHNSKAARPCYMVALLPSPVLMKT